MGSSVQKADLKPKGGIGSNESTLNLAQASFPAGLCRRGGRAPAGPGGDGGPPGGRGLRGRRGCGGGDEATDGDGDDGWRPRRRRGQSRRAARDPFCAAAVAERGRKWHYY